MDIYKLIPRVMAEVGAIEKARRNEQQKYFFRGIDDVFAAFQPVLAKHQVFYVPEVLEKQVTERESASNRTLIYTTLTVMYTFYAPDGSNIRAVVVGEAMDSGDKSSNKAMSAALKYALLQIFCVPTEANEDADAHSPELAPKAKPDAAEAAKDVEASLAKALSVFGITPDSKEEAELVMDALRLTESRKIKALTLTQKQELVEKLRERVRAAKAGAAAA